MDSWLNKSRALVTGATSGLGKSLVEILLEHNSKVISVGRNGGVLENSGDHFMHIDCDFADLSSVQRLIETLVDKKIHIDLLVNNAGILSPPEYRQSKDNIELSFQVNFLAHVYLTHELISKGILNTVCIVNISSPIHTRGQLNLSEAHGADSYRLLQAYANSKLYMALFSQHLVELGHRSFSFNPGTFSSGIYREQKRWFHLMYRVASPFMISSQKVAKGLFKVIESKSWVDGKMMNRLGNISKMLTCDHKDVDIFWQHVNQMLDRHRAELADKLE